MAKPSRMTYETSQPWVVYEFGRTHDGIWPPWSSTRVLGRACVKTVCAICGTTEMLWIRISRIGAIPDNGPHPKRTAFLRRHQHDTRPEPMAWALPLLNPDVHQHGVDLDALAMRLQADALAEGDPE